MSPSHLPAKSQSNYYYYTTGHTAANSTSTATNFPNPVRIVFDLNIFKAVVLDLNLLESGGFSQFSGYLPDTLPENWILHKLT